MLDGRKVKAAREAIGFTGRVFARLVGISPSTLTKIEDNDYPGLKLDMAQLVAAALHVHLCVLLKEAQLPHQHMAGSAPLER